VVDQGPPTAVAHSSVVPAPQPVALMVPVVDGHTLLVIVMVGAPGIGFTVIVELDVAVQPFAAVTVTMYMVVLAGVTGLAAVVVALLHI
jgi:hypothetical protein